MADQPSCQPGVTPDAAAALYAALRDERDLSCVLLSASFLDRCLENLLEAYLAASSTTEKLLDPRGGFLGSFAARSDACYCLGLVSKRFYQNLLTIATLRNTFAHSHLDLSFEAPRIAELCFRLHTPPFIADGCDIRARDDAEYQSLCGNARDRFTIVVALMANQLITKAADTPHRPPASDWWS
ncbi:MAG: hypothetical protein LC135_12000 [Phycisphaerae bacterium]|nr:hypothetical protein [Phycisphaerae bacterium]MCZ2400572.1 hypothetical protein [Phycisphaerae bacterium]NUQ49211.1 hypothetical protein [Phycisphaerae bacterium]